MSYLYSCSLSILAKNLILIVRNQGFRLAIIQAVGMILSILTLQARGTQQTDLGTRADGSAWGNQDCTARGATSVSILHISLSACGIVIYVRSFTWNEQNSILGPPKSFLCSTMGVRRNRLNDVLDILQLLGSQACANKITERVRILVFVHGETSGPFMASQDSRNPPPIAFVPSRPAKGRGANRCGAPAPITEDLINSSTGPRAPPPRRSRLPVRLRAARRMLRRILLAQARTRPAHPARAPGGAAARAANRPRPRA